MNKVSNKPIAEKLILNKVIKNNGKVKYATPVINGIMTKRLASKVNRMKGKDVLRKYKPTYRRTVSDKIKKRISKIMNKSKILDRAFSGEWISFEEIKAFGEECDREAEFSEYGESLRYGGYNNFKRKRARNKQNKLNPLDDEYNRNFVEDREII